MRSRLAGCSLVGQSLQHGNRFGQRYATIEKMPEDGAEPSEPQALHEFLDEYGSLDPNRLEQVVSLLSPEKCGGVHTQCPVHDIQEYDLVRGYEATIFMRERGLRCWYPHRSRKSQSSGCRPGLKA
jgi:hypothetical protein